MKKVIPVLLITITTACSGQAVPTPFPTPVPLPSVASSPGPTSTLAPTTKTPLVTPLAFSVSLDPQAQTIPAGASTSFFVSVTPEGTAAGPFPRWSVAGMPSGATLESEPYASPFHATQIIHTTCNTPQGISMLGVGAEISGTYKSVDLKLQVADRLKDSSPGSYTGSFSKDIIYSRRGGPSTLRYGPSLNLQFCDSAVPRKLRVTVREATSVAGTPLSEPPSFSLFRSLVWPAPHELQTTGGGYIVNAREVASSQGGTLEWQIGGGVYILMFQRSPLQDSQPPETRPAAVSYAVQVGP